jgi:hypothetical protein
MNDLVHSGSQTPAPRPFSPKGLRIFSTGIIPRVKRDDRNLPSLKGLHNPTPRIRNPFRVGIVRMDTHTPRIAILGWRYVTSSR